MKNVFYSLHDLLLKHGGHGESPPTPKGGGHSDKVISNYSLLIERSSSYLNPDGCPLWGIGGFSDKKISVVSVSSALNFSIIT